MQARLLFFVNQTAISTQVSAAELTQHSSSAQTMTIFVFYNGGSHTGILRVAFKCAESKAVNNTCSIHTHTHTTKTTNTTATEPFLDV